MLSKHTPKKLLLSVLCLVFSRFIRQENLLLVASKHGYVGNAAALFESVLDCRGLEYGIFWSGNSQGMPANKAVKTNNIFREAILLCRAKFALYTHAPSDISIHIPKRVTRINMWHGNPIKYILDDVPEKESTYKKMKKSFLNQNPKDSDYFLCGGSRFIEIMSGCTSLPVDRILNTGLPRNQVFYRSSCSASKVLPFFLFAPTFRDKSTQEERIELLAMKWKKIYDEKGFLLVIKLHPNDKTDLSMLAGMEWVIIESNMSDINELLRKSIALITDYSSVAFDYLVLRKPVHILMDDLPEYLGSRGGFYIKIEELERVFNVSRSVTSLIESIKSGRGLLVTDTGDVYNKKFDVENLLKLLGEAS